MLRHSRHLLLVIVCGLAVLCSSAAAAEPIHLRLSQGRFGHEYTTGGPPFAVRAPLAALLARHGFTGVPTTKNLPINGSVWPVGGFETMIYLGVPPQEQLVQIDTGSADLLVAQAGCKACPNPKYHPTRSSASRPVRCNSSQFVCKGCAGIDNDMCMYNNTYETCDYSDPSATCSLVGTTFYDVASLGDSTISATVGFGGIQEHQGAFDNEWTNMPGVMGMGYPRLAAVWRNNTVFNSWVEAGDLAAVFGMCINDTIGHLTLGAIDARYYTGDLVFTPVVDQAWYVLHMLDLGVDGTSVGLPSSYYNKIGSPEGTILDSGTNTFVIGGEAFDAVEKLMLAQCDQEPLQGVCNVPQDKNLFSGACFPMDAADIDAFPSVYVTLDQASPLSIGGQQYLIQHPEKDGHYCLGIQSSGPSGFTILGNVFQSAFYVVFDQVHNQLGFAPAANCE